MSISIWMDSSKDKSVITKDIIIIGGGIAGLSSAYWLIKEDPSLNIAIVEKYECGDGASGRNAGFITCGSVEHFNRLAETFGKEKAFDIWKFSEENLRLLKEEIIGEEEDKLFFEEKGSFSLASSENEWDELKTCALLMEQLNINVELLEEQSIKSRLQVEGFLGGVKYVDDASVHPLHLLNKIKSFLINKKVEIFEHHEVFSIESNATNDEKVIHTKKRRFRCPVTIFAMNGYSSILNPFFKDKIFPTRGQILATTPVELFLEGPCYANFVLDYFRQLPTGELVIGGFRQLKKDAEVGYSDETTEIIQKALDQFLQDHLPRMKKAKITHRWSGVMGFSVDGQPMVGALPTDPQSFFIGGFTAHGLGLAFHCAKVLGDMLFGREIPDFVSAKRFGK